MELERFAIHDGPGIRTVVFLQGCPLRCPWCANPESWELRDRLLYTEDRCIRCGACAAICPSGAARMEDVTHRGKTARMEDAACMKGAACVEEPAGDAAVSAGPSAAIAALPEAQAGPPAAGPGPQFDRRRCTACGACAGACAQGALRIAGKVMSADAIMAVILRDRDYYKASGGGVTFSGGEPFFQFPALKTLLERCREKGLDTAVETSGQAEPALVMAAAPLVNRFLLDLKTADPRKFRETCGGAEAAFRNIAWLGAHQASGAADLPVAGPAVRSVAAAIRKSGFLVTGRIPVIPGFNADGESMAAIFALAGRHGIRQVELLPYHTLGKGKYRELDLEYRGPAEKMLKKEDLLPLAKLGSGMGLEVTVR